MTILTHEYVATLKPEGDKRDQIFFDSETSGFGVRVRFDINGKLCRTWIKQYRNEDGQQRRQTIGKFPRMNAKTARSKAIAWNDKLERGIDPAGEREVERAATKLTFIKAATEYLAVRQREGGMRDSSYSNIELYLTGKYFASFHSMPVAKVTNSHVSTALNNIPTAPSRSQAQRKLSTFFTWAVMEGHAPENPVAKTKPVKAGPARDRVLSKDEIRKVWKACKDDDLGRIIKLLLLPGCRADEIGCARWSWINLDEGTITLPAEVKDGIGRFKGTKNRRTHVLPLPPLALQIINEVEQVPGRVHLFGKWTDSGFTNWARARSTLADGLPHWTIHDLRRTAATHMAELGVEPHVIEAILNHVSGHKGGIAGIYNRASYFRQMKTALAVWAEHVASIVSGAASKVVALRA
jgi:integrase